MIEKEIRKLKRAQLIDMVIEQDKVLAELREQLEIANKKLTDRRIMTEQVGNIAEASLQLNGIFEAAQASVQQYMENVHRMCESQETICAEMESNCRAKCEELERETKEECDFLERETKEKCDLLERETKEKCDAMQEAAEKGVEARWSELSLRLEKFYKDHQDLQKLLNATKE